MSTAELANAYAALILADDGVDITADKLSAIIKAAGISEVEPIWSTLFAKVRLPLHDLERSQKEESDDDMGFGLFD
ncbi:hypothetical protein DV737_g1451, partial [Chaetothyriales sp. CBS 132003]